MTFVDVQICKTLVEFRQLGQEWAGLVGECPEQNVFLTHEFLMSWLRSKNMAAHLAVMIVRRGGQLVTAAPFYIDRRKSGIRTLRFIGDGYSDFGDVLVKRGSEDALGAIGKALLREGTGWDTLDLKYLPKDSPFANVIRQASSVESQFAPVIGNPFVSVRDDWRENVTTKLRKQLRLGYRNLESKVGTLKLTIAVEPDAVAEALERFFELHQCRWIGMKGDISRFAIESERREYTELFLEMARHGRVIIARLEAPVGPVAIAVNLLYAGRLYYCQPAFDPQFAKYSPSKLLIALLLDYCAREGVAIFDFLRGDEDYKLQWGAQRRDLYRLYARRRTATACLAMVWDVKWRERIRQLELVRRGVRRVRWSLAKRGTTPRPGA